MRGMGVNTAEESTGEPVIFFMIELGFPDLLRAAIIQEPSIVNIKNTTMKSTGMTPLICAGKKKFRVT